MTLSFIAALSVLIAVQVGLVDKDLKRLNEEKFLHQNNLILADLKTIILPSLFANLKQLDFLLDQKNDKNTSNNIKQKILKEIYGLPLPIINDTKIGLMVLMLKPTGVKLNINILKQLKNFEQRAFLEHLLNDLDNSQDLLDLIDLALNQKNLTNEQLFLDEDHPLNSSFFNKKRFYNYEHFKQVLEVYYKQSEDQKIYDIQWQDLLDFQDEKRDQLYFYAIEPIVCKKFLLFDRNEFDQVKFCQNKDRKLYKKEDLMLSDEEAKRFKQLNVNFGYNPLVRIEVMIRQDKFESSFSFDYNMDNFSMSNLDL